MKFSQLVLKTLVVVIASFLALSNVGAQTQEHIFILWDVSGSLLPQKEGTKDLDGKNVPADSKGNGMWVALKNSIIDCIDYIDEDPSNKITIITFNDNIRDKQTDNATQEGKDSLKKFVETYQFEPHKSTNIVEPIRNFYDLIDGNSINYMFLFTDGVNDCKATEKQFIPTLDDWTNRVKNKNAYGFYVLVDPAADKPEIRKSVESQDNFWIVTNAKVQINIGTFQNPIAYNVRDEKNKEIRINGKFKHAEGKVRLVANDEYYDVKSDFATLKDGKVNISVTKKNDADIPESHTIQLTPEVKDADSYTFVGPQKIDLVVSCKPERSMLMNIDDKKVNASYYGSFLWVKENNDIATTTIDVEFSEQAKQEGSSAKMKIYFVDKKGKLLSAPGLTVLVNDKPLDGDSYLLTPNETAVTIAISGDAKTKEGTYYGRIQIDSPKKLDRYSINDEQEAYKLEVKFEQEYNPLAFWLLVILCVLILLVLLWKFVLCPMFYPRFKTAMKYFTIPNKALFSIKFSGKRKVVIAKEVKKQSLWNKFWTGEIYYYRCDEFETPLEFKPAGGKYKGIRCLGKYKVFQQVKNGKKSIYIIPYGGGERIIIENEETGMKINVD